MKNFKKSKLQTYNEKFVGGFESLNEGQIAKIKGGLKDLESVNGLMCDNSGNCTGSANEKNCV